jgi:dTDP-4-dehydrorhamnose reductase
MKILLTGANGLLGQHLLQLILKETDCMVFAVGKGNCRTEFLHNKRLQYFSLDITDAVAASRLYLEQQPGIIIHAAAITQVDDCESDKVKCWNTNVTATRFLIEAAKKLNAFFVYVSTDFVFDGEKGNYSETDLTGPVNYYGSSKLAAENAVIDSGLNAAIVRTCLVYGNLVNGSRTNFISWVKENLQEGKTIKVVNDQYRTPTYIEDLAKGILLVAEKRAKGIFHISGEEVLTPYEMAMLTADFLSLDKSLVEKVDASSFTQTAKRPAKTGFVITKAKNELGYQPINFNGGLKKMFGK